MIEKKLYAKLPLWRLVDIATREMTESGKEYFTRQEIYDYVNNVLLQHTSEKKEEHSMSPIIQGITVNAPGGAPGAVNRKILYRVDRGLYRRLNSAEEALPYSGYKTPAGKQAEIELLERWRRYDPSEPLGTIEEFLSQLAQEEIYTARVNESGGVLLPQSVLDKMEVKPGDILVFQPVEGRKCLMEKGRLKLEIEED
jgi:hypothetical protein